MSASSTTAGRRRTGRGAVHLSPERQQALTGLKESQAVGFAVAVFVVLAAYVTLRQEPGWQAPVLRGFVVLVLTLLPAFLYIRFVKFRLGPLRTEYIYNLHRLQLDDPGSLPKPPVSSKFHAGWKKDVESRGVSLESAAHDPDNIYKVKFQTQYGRWPKDDNENFQEGFGSRLSIYLCTAVVGVGSAAVVWFPPAQATGRLQGALGYAFLGSYFFILSALTRRFFQNDLRPGAYLAAMVRITTVLILVVAVEQVLAPGEVPDRTLNACAFLIGIFPSVGLQLIRKGIGKVTGRIRGGLEPPFPLGQLDGMDIWTEARLLEVGIEDVQHLAKANLVDIALATRIPMQRVVDWVDQGLLLLHSGLPREDNSAGSTYLQLRRLGIRSATDLVAFTSRLGIDLEHRGGWPAPDDPAVGVLVAATGNETTGLLTRAAVISTCLAKEPNLVLIENWLSDGEGTTHACPVRVVPAPV